MDAINFFHANLHDWYARYGRTFPWRETTDPYQVLIAELMLRRTQARQVEPVYREFVAKFPDAGALAAADPTEVATTVYSLGLPRRALQFQEMATQVVAQTGGIIPHDRRVTRACRGRRLCRERSADGGIGRNGRASGHEYRAGGRAIPRVLHARRVATQAGSTDGYRDAD